MFLVHIGYRLGNRRAVRAQHRVNFVLRNELLVKTGRCLPIRRIVIDDKLNLASKYSALLVHMLLAKQVALTKVATLYGGLTGERRGCADSDRLLREARRCRPTGKCDRKRE